MNPTNDVRERLRSTNEYLNLTTKFKCEGTVNKEDFRTTACFAKVLKTHFKDMDNTYYIKIFKNRKEGSNNLLMFTEEEVEKYFRYIEEVVGPLDWTFTDDNGEPDDYYLITIHINGPHFLHTFIITSIRYLYEKNYAIMLNEAMMLKQTYRFRNENIYTLMALVLDSNPGLSHVMSTDMSHFNTNAILELLSTDELKNRIQEFSNCHYIKKGPNSVTYHAMKSITALFLHKAYAIGHKNIGLKYADIYENSSNGEYLLDDKFIKRYIIYRHNYDVIKQISNPSFKKELDIRGKYYGWNKFEVEGTDKNVFSDTIDNFNFDSFYPEHNYDY